MTYHLIPSLDLAGVVVGGGGAGELDGLAVQRGVSEQVAEILEKLQQLVGGVLKDGQHLSGHHVVHDEEGRLWERWDNPHTARNGDMCYYRVTNDVPS